jgi:hypothetical protein
MDKLITQIVKQQNQVLIENLCTKYNLDQEDMFKKYLIPRYYVIGGDGRSYDVEWKETGKPKE